MVFPCQLMCTMTPPLDWPWKIPQNDPKRFEICPLDQKLWSFVFPCTVDHHWIGFKNYPKMTLTLWNPSYGSEVMEMCFSVSADVYNDLTIGWALKTIPKWCLTLWNPSIGSEVMDMWFSMSAHMYSDLIIRLALKIYPKMMPDTLISIH